MLRIARLILTLFSWAFSRRAIGYATLLPNVLHNHADVCGWLN
jgi:hypothetical protein